MMIEWYKIKKVVDNKASNKEQEEVDRWVKQSSLHRSYMRNITNYYDNEGADFKYKSDEELRNKLFALKIRSKKRRSSRRVNIAATVACCAGAMLFLSFLIYQQTSKPAVLAENATTEHLPIQPIEDLADKIVLVKGDSEYNIESEDTHIAGTAKSNSTTLTYNNEVEDTTIVEYHTIRVPKGKDFKLVLADGSVAWLNSNSELKYPTHFTKGAERVVEIKGEAFFDVKQSSADKFIVKAANSVDVKVYGTRFNVNAYNTNSIETTLVTGSLSVASKDNPKEVFIKPDNRATVSEEGIAVEECDASKVALWTEGVLLFDNITLTEIIDRLPYIYSVETNWVDETYKSEIFYCRVAKTTDINTILLALGNIGKAKFELKDGVIYIK